MTTGPGIERRATHAPSVAAAPAPAARHNALVALSATVAVLACAAAASGLFLGGGDGPVNVTSIHGASATLYGRGLYRHDTLFNGAAYRAQDLVTVVLAVPALLLATFSYARGVSGGALLLSGVLGFFVYAYGSFALGAAYNAVYLLYVPAFSASVFALALSFRESASDVGAVAAGDFAAGVDVGKNGAGEVPAGAGVGEAGVGERTAGGDEPIDRDPPPRPLPRRGPAALLIASGLGTIGIWLPPVVSSRLTGEPPPLLGTYTTLVTETLDLALIAPTTILAGVLILRRRPLGYRLAFPLFGIIVLLTPTIAAATASQVAAGVEFTPGQIAGPIAAFVAMGLLSVWAGAAIIRTIQRNARLFVSRSGG